MIFNDEAREIAEHYSDITTAWSDAIHEVNYSSESLTLESEALSHEIDYLAPVIHCGERSIVYRLFCDSWQSAEGDYFISIKDAIEYLTEGENKI